MQSSTVFCLWGGCDKEDIDSLQVLQNRAACWLIVYFSTMAVFAIRMSGKPAELARLFRNESLTGRMTLSSKNPTCSRWVCL